ncbi:MAG TPA: hypothetical protein VI358_18965, partial [Pseudolabrys sp.]
MREQLLPDSKIAPHTRRSIPILRGLAYLSAYGVKPAGDASVKHPLHASLYRHELRGEHDLVVGHFLQQAHL